MLKDLYMGLGTIEAVNFLLKKGHRVIGMINGPDKLVASQQRLEGYLKALQEHRLKFDPNLIISSDLTTTVPTGDLACN